MHTSPIRDQRVRIPTPTKACVPYNSDLFLRQRCPSMFPCIIRRPTNLLSSNANLRPYRRIFKHRHLQMYRRRLIRYHPTNIIFPYIRAIPTNSYRERSPWPFLGRQGGVGVSVGGVIESFTSLKRTGGQSSICIGTIDLLYTTVITLILFFVGVAIHKIASEVLIIGANKRFLRLGSVRASGLCRALLGTRYGTITCCMGSFSEVDVSKGRTRTIFLIRGSRLGTV